MRSKGRALLRSVFQGLLCSMILATWPDLAAAVAPTSVMQRRAAVVERASRLLDEAQVSYVYGGHQLGDSQACNRCNTCLNSRQPAPAQRLKVCTACQSCSLDCSHFTALVFSQAALPYPYLDTALMLSLSPEALRRRYHMVDLGTNLAAAAPGDLLVYAGHVVLLEKIEHPTLGGAEWRGDIVHATGGKEIRRPGEGIQRARFADLAHFRGSLLRILRHSLLLDADRESKQVRESEQVREPVQVRVPSHRVPLGRLRPVERRPPSDGDDG